MAVACILLLLLAVTMIFVNRRRIYEKRRSPTENIRQREYEIRKTELEEAVENLTDEQRFVAAQFQLKQKIIVFNEDAFRDQRQIALDAAAMSPRSRTTVRQVFHSVKALKISPQRHF
ncbi:unnamed protein product [Gongylonema pulchrum]|uniref:DUF2489 domain-containing protein n=1 Tax=Gongylonema pulchrum TaxID=637853 RepID=A0A183D931_9BILA|nr:unnamed protein product [Gongylonema pulchrum]